MEFTELPLNLPGKVYRSAMPFSMYDPDGQLIKAYRDNDVDLVVMLASDEESLRVTGLDLRSMYLEEGFQGLYLPIPDFSIPRDQELKEAIQEVLAHLQSGENICIHCQAGIGRTGMFAAGLAKLGMGLSSEGAIKLVRDSIPGAIEVPEQEILVRSL